MTISVAYEVFCDGCFIEWFRCNFAESRKDAIEEAKEQGWKMTRTRHLCPDCNQDKGDLCTPTKQK